MGLGWVRVRVRVGRGEPVEQRFLDERELGGCDEGEVDQRGDRALAAAG